MGFVPNAPWCVYTSVGCIRYIFSVAPRRLQFPVVVSERMNPDHEELKLREWFIRIGYLSVIIQWRGKRKRKT